VVFKVEIIDTGADNAKVDPADGNCQCQCKETISLLKRQLFAGKSRIAVLIVLDIVFLSVVYCAFLLRYMYRASTIHLHSIARFFFLMLGSVLFCRFVFRIYRQVWRYADYRVFLLMFMADLAGGAFYLVLETFLLERHLPLLITVSAFSIALLVTLASRFLYQYLRKRQDDLLPSRSAVPLEKTNKINVAIVGAGKMGVFLTQELLMNPNSRYHPMYLIDNDPRKIGTSIHGAQVIGPDHQVIPRINKLPIQEIIIALPQMEPEAREILFKQYMETGCKVLVYDYPIERLSQQNSKRLVRDINIEDLLFRAPISLKDPQAHNYYQGKVILVTGAGGSIGSELSRQLARFQPKQLVLLDIYENGVYDLGQELRRRYGDSLNMRIVIASVCDVNRINQVFERFRPEVVLHAAAHKHVPLMEDNCAEAIHNNVFGTYYTAMAAEKYGTRRFVLISTDKAVNPTNMMGATKRMCEMIVQSRQDSQTQFAAVRFGNVLGSAGSVVPLFRRQIEEGGPVTITDKRIIRYFMTIPEAAQLVLRTGTRAEKSEVYVLDMGKPIKILDLANKMISLSGLVPDQDIKIKEIGLRPGEKLYEELLVRVEECTRTDDERIFIEKGNAPDREAVDRTLRALRQALDMHADDDLLKELMMRILPSYRDAHEVNEKAADAAEMQATGVNGVDVLEILGTST
jgi:FlaA1/EpsC-like NDP-sugar epimerase